MNLKFKKLHPDAVTPSKAHVYDAGLDLTAISATYSNEYRYWEYDTGIAVSIDPGFVGFMTPRSSISKTGLYMCNSLGTIDSGYTGSLKARFYEGTIPGIRSKRYEVGDKIAQLVIMPISLATSLEEVEDLGESDRGTGGFGSTGQ